MAARSNLILALSIFALVAVNFVTSAPQPADTKKTSSDEASTLEAVKKLAAEGKFPVMYVSQKAGSQKPDIYWAWIEWPAFSQFQQFLKPVQGFTSPITEQISQLLLTNIPNADSIFNQINDMGSQLSNTFNPSSMLGNLPGMGANSGKGASNSSPLSTITSLIPNLGR